MPVPVMPPPITITSSGSPSASAASSAARRDCVECRRAGHGFRYPFSEWASSTSSASASRIGATICAGLDRRLGDQQAHRRELARVAGPHAALVLGELDVGGHRVDEDLLAGAEPLGDVHHRQLGRLVQHRHDHVVVAQLLGDRDDPLDQRFAADPAARHVASSTPTIRVVSSAARIDRVSGQRR